MYFDPVKTGKRIKKLREKHELTQIEFAERLNIDRSFVSKIESGTKAPSIDVLVEMSVKFNISTDYLLMGINTDPRITKEALLSMAASITDFANYLEV